MEANSVFVSTFAVTPFNSSKLIRFSFPQISDIKRLNKIEKEIEIHARNTLKVPINAHTLLLSTGNIDALPIVHKSGQSSPKHATANPDGSSISNTSHNNHQLMPNDRLKLDEKLLIASVSLAAPNGGAGSDQLVIPTITTNTSHPTTTNGHIAVRRYTDNETIEGRDAFFNDPLLAHLDSGPHVIRGAPKNDLSCSGSDCDISWICLLVCILALCFAIPLIYVIYIAEHPERFNHTDSAWRLPTTVQHPFHASILWEKTIIITAKRIFVRKWKRTDNTRWQNVSIFLYPWTSNIRSEVFLNFIQTFPDFMRWNMFTWRVEDKNWFCIKKKKK